MINSMLKCYCSDRLAWKKTEKQLYLIKQNNNHRQLENYNKTNLENFYNDTVTQIYYVDTWSYTREFKNNKHTVQKVPKTDWHTYQDRMNLHILAKEEQMCKIYSWQRT